MRNLATLGLFLATVVSSLPTQSPYDDLVKRKDDNCEVEWVTVYSRDPAVQNGANKGKKTTGSGTTQDSATGSSAVQSAGSAVPTSTSQTSSTAGSGSTSNGNITGTVAGSGGPSQLTFPTDIKFANGQSPFPINDDHLKAPQPTDPVPDDAYVFTPSKSDVFIPSEFEAFVKPFRMTENDPSIHKSRWIQFKAGTYYYAPSPAAENGQDPNTVGGVNAQMYQMFSGWTLDLRGVTLYLDYSPATKDRRGAPFYFLQSTGLTVLGGTIWVDRGEIFTQAVVTSVTGTEAAGDLTATFEVQAGYTLSTWRTINARNVYCRDPTSNPDKVIDGNCNFWWVNNFNFDKLDSDRTFTAHLNDLKTSGVPVGTIIGMLDGDDTNTPDIITNEDNGGLTVKGMTTNGGLGSIGVNDGETPPHLIDYWYVEPPARPGFAPRAFGPGMSFAHPEPTFYNVGDRPLTTFDNCFYQQSYKTTDLLQVSQTNHG